MSANDQVQTVEWLSTEISAPVSLKLIATAVRPGGSRHVAETNGGLDPDAPAPAPTPPFTGNASNKPPTFG
jgi:hypothetical protein